jgi:hypothetical protein
MPDEPTTETTTATTTEPGTAPAGEPKLFTQEQVNAIVQKRVADSKAIKPTVQTQPAVTLSGDDRVAQLERKLEFRDMADQHNIPREQRGDLFDLYEAQKPSDTAAWFESKGRLFGRSTVTTTDPTTTTAAAPDPMRVPAVAPSSSQPSAVSPITTGGLVDIYNLTPEQFASMTPAEMRAHHEKNISAAGARSGAPRLPATAQKR